MIKILPDRAGQPDSQNCCLSQAAVPYKLLFLCENMTLSIHETGSLAKKGKKNPGENG